jgi:hypothetical protein
MMLIVAAMVLQGTPAQNVRLPAPERVLPVDFTQVRGLRELPDGRVLISDRLDRGVVIADFAKGTVAQVGRTGPGPAEYRLPTTLTALPGDSTLLLDEGNQRVAIIGPDLKIHRSFTLMLPGIGVPLSARSMDPRGRFHLQIPAWVMDTPLPGDSVLVVRFDPRTQRVDTMARIKGYTRRKNTQTPGMPYVMFAPQDVWTVTLDGRVAVVRSGDYHVDWRDVDGRVMAGPPIAWERRPVTFDDRYAHTKRFMENSSISGRDAAGGLSALPAEMLAPEQIREVATQQEFAPTHAPFNAVSPLVSPDGNLWVERSMKLGTPETWDVIDGKGVLFARVTMSEDRRLVGLSTRWLYAVVTDEDGLQKVERYRLPVSAVSANRPPSSLPLCDEEAA